MVAGCHLAAGCAVAAEDVVKSYGAVSSAVFALRGFRCRCGGASESHDWGNRAV